MNVGEVAQNLNEIGKLIKSQPFVTLPIEKLTKYMEALGYAESFIQQQVRDRQKYTLCLEIEYPRAISEAYIEGQYPLLENDIIVTDADGRDHCLTFSYNNSFIHYHSQSPTLIVSYHTTNSGKINIDVLKRIKEIKEININLEAIKNQNIYPIRLHKMVFMVEKENNRHEIEMIEVPSKIIESYQFPKLIREIQEEQEIQEEKEL